jgi:hypothetical protein
LQHASVLQYACGQQLFTKMKCNNMMQHDMLVQAAMQLHCIRSGSICSVSSRSPCLPACCCRKALATVPLLAHVLQPCSLLRLLGRRLLPGAFPGFDALLGQAQQAGAPVMVLWPGPGAHLTCGWACSL